MAKTGASDGELPVAVVRALAELCHREGVEALEAEDGVWSIRLQVDLTAPLATAAPPALDADRAVEALYVLTSQWVGVFHRAPVVGMAPYVREGQPVKVGDVLGVVIAMQLQHEVVAARSGVLLRFLVEDGSAVEYGEPLLEID
jgi:acetyl-CoA carboxylase biotin carboxyl carrier protein